ncbi:hypothetical protein R20943_02264 [Paraburkholderia aspalathi]|nr:hypothetical protein R20943_02264 [Paraburkholderia aspalathi]
MAVGRPEPIAVTGSGMSRDGGFAYLARVPAINRIAPKATSTQGLWWSANGPLFVH